MTYVRWEYYESITVTYESRDTVTPERGPSWLTEMRHVPTDTPRDANRLLWVAPMALAAGAAIVREANRRNMFPRLAGAVRLLALGRGRTAALPGQAPLALRSGDEPNSGRALRAN